MSFAQEHADALADLTANGQSVTFSYQTAGTYDAATDTTSGAETVTITGAALRVKGDPRRYQALELIASEAPALLFVPTVYGRLPRVGATVDFGGTRFTVKDVEPVAPDGTAIMARIIVAGGGPIPTTGAVAFALPAFSLAGAGRLTFRGDGALALSALSLAGAGDNGVLFQYEPGDSLSSATFSRSSTATYRDADGVVQSVASGVARDSHYALNPVTSLYERSTLLEGSRTNWVKNSALATDSNADGLADNWTASASSSLSLSGGEQTATATAQFGAVFHEIDFGAATGPITFSAELKGATVRLIVYLYDSTGTYLGAIASGNTTDAANFTPHTAATTRTDVKTARMRMEDPRSSGWTPMTMRRPQAEVASFASSWISTPAGATASRAADSLSFPFAHAPQEMTVYARFVERGTALVSGALRLFQIGEPAGTSGFVNRLIVYTSGSGSYYAQYSTTAGAKNTTAVGSVAVGDMVETRLVMAANTDLTLGVSVNGSAESLGTTGVALAMGATFGATPQIHVGHSGSGSPGFAAFQSVVVARGIKSLDFMRSL